jgi:SAM-dependent methyltransferase
MGFICGNLRVLLSHRRKGVSFRKMILIGRQQIFLRPSEIEGLAREFPEFAAQIRSCKPAFGDFSEDWLEKCLGAEVVDSIDASDFEGATFVHDMNLELGHANLLSEIVGAYDAVIDAGSLEHIFNVPIALKNCMRLVKPGGLLCLATVANNYCGHGFYQFSPEFFFRVLQPENGFDHSEVLLLTHPFPGAELSGSQKIYEVKDPFEVGARVGIVTQSPVMIIASAIKSSAVDVFKAFPQQSDYQKRWDSGASTITDSEQSSVTRYAAVSQLRRVLGYLFRSIKSKLPTNFQRSLSGIEQRAAYSLRNRKHFKVWKP